MSNVKDKEERRVKKAKIDLLRTPQYALWSGVMMVSPAERCSITILAH